MGNYRFRLSDMMSSSWFCKFKDMSRANRSQSQSQSIQHPMKKSQTPAATTASTPTPPPTQHQDYLPYRASSYIPSKKRVEKLPHSPVNTKASDTHFPVEPVLRKSNPKTQRKSTKPCATVVSSSSCNCRPTSISEFDDDIEFDSTNMFSNKFEDLEVVSELKLPPILTKPVKKEVHKSALHKTKKTTTTTRRSVSGIHRHGIKVRHNSPRVGGRKSQAYRNPSGAAPNAALQRRASPSSENLVVIKSSSNPMRDFMESMVEMIVENNIHEPDDLEELLASYLSMNSKEYHEVIIKVFEHIWFALTDARM